jgi:hypothetical protein
MERAQEIGGMKKVTNLGHMDVYYLCFKPQA